MRQFIIPFITVMVAMMAIEVVWFAIVVERLYRPELGDILATDVRILPAVLFYVLYPASVVYLAIRPFDNVVTVRNSFVRAAVLGLTAYGTYELTNLATVEGWSATVTVIDIVWGAVLTSVSACLATVVLLRFGRNTGQNVSN